MLDTLIDEFIRYRRSVRNNADLTVTAYEMDLKQFNSFVREQNTNYLAQIDLTLLRSYFGSRLTKNYSRATLSRKQASLKAFFAWLRRTGKITSDPTRGLRAPRLQRKLPKFLRSQEIEALL